MTRSSGPRTARTMQNSVAPSAAVSAAAARTSSVSRKGVAFTGVSKRDDCEQKWQSSGHPPVLADRMPSTSTVGPHHASLTSWATEASPVTDSSGTTARPANSTASSRRRSSSRAVAAAAMRALASDGLGGAGRRTGQGSTGARRETVLCVGATVASAGTGTR